MQYKNIKVTTMGRKYTVHKIIIIADKYIMIMTICNLRKCFNEHNKFNIYIYKIPRDF